MHARISRRSLGVAAGLVGLVAAAPAAMAVPSLTGSGTSAPAAAAAAPATFDAVVGLGGCSASIVRYPQSTDADPAMLLTNGHCLPGSVGQPAAGKAIVDRPVSLTGVVLAGPKADEKGQITVDRVAYATTTGTDIALMRTTMTYGTFASTFGVSARTIRAQKAADGTAIVLPSGFWKHDWHCTIGSTVPTVLEDKYVWKDSIKYSGAECAGYKGSSGTPIIDEKLGDVVGINNTSNVKGAMCTTDNPCEVDAGGKKTAVQGASYGQQTWQITQCINSARAFDLTVRGCTLTGTKASARTTQGVAPSSTETASSQTYTPPTQGIINGTPAKATNGTVAFMYNNGPICTGSLIGPTWALTAKHCLVYSSETRVYAVRIGSLDSKSGGYLVPVKEMTSKNDMTLLKLAWASYSTEKPVVLADADPAVGSKVIARGYGRTSANNSTPHNILNETTLKVTSLNAHDNAYGPAFTAVGDKTSPFSGDSGGPSFDEAGKQVGTVSTGVISSFSCNYASVARNRAWIRSVSGI